MDFDESFDATRSYEAPGSRMQKKAAVLKDHVRFGRWRYSWRDAEYLIYEIEYVQALQPPTRLYYVLSPRSGGVVENYNARTDQLLLEVGAWGTDLHEEIYVFDDGYWSKNRELWQSVQGSSWDEVILDPKTKANLIEDVHGFFDNQHLYKKLAVPWKRGLIFHGVPGNGKTISIKALINALSARADPVPSLYVKSFDACQGPKLSIRTIFERARIMAPCLLIFEDLDSLIDDKTRSYFLNEVDGLESNDGILMIGSTNHLSGLDPAISQRPSRFDRKYHFKIPGEEERIAYCQFWRRKLLDSDLVDFHEDICLVIAKMTEGFSFAYLKELFIVSLLTIARGGTADEDEAIEEDKSTSGASSTDGHVLIQHEEASEDANNTASTNDTQAEKQKAEAVQNKRVIPDVHIPASVKDNLLLKVVRAQTKLLLDEMDNTKEEIICRKRRRDSLHVEIPRVLEWLWLVCMQLG